MAERAIYRVTLLVPGAAPTREAWSAALREQGLALEAGGALRGDGIEVTAQAEWVENDGGFGAAFSFGTVPPEGVAAIEAAPSALVVDLPVDLLTGRAEIVAIVERLRSAGAVAVRFEQSKLGWEIGTWLEVFSAEDPWAWHRHSVVFLGDDDVLQSCGMHLYSLPDVRIAVDGDPNELQHFGSILNLYQIDEDPMLRSGETFSVAADAPRRVLERWPDSGYPPDDPCHNPYGVWRVGPSGGAARSLGEHDPTFVPALVVTLTHLEQQAGRPLTRERVEAIRDEAPCIAMEPRQAQQLERSRGYADLNPEFAWEQWQLVRSSQGGIED